MTTDTPVHIAVVLDRSGSMASIADDVVGGFNAYLGEQQKVRGEARLTLAQFDSEDPFEVLVDGNDITTVQPLAREAYRPRGTTPLFDAIGRMIARIDTEVARRRVDGEPAEDQVVVILTDGLENASREFSRADVLPLIEHRRSSGWVFVFLGADQDSLAAGGAIGVAAPNARNWSKSKQGVEQVYRDLSRSTTLHREKAAALRRQDADHFYVPEAESEPAK